MNSSKIIKVTDVEDLNIKFKTETGADLFKRLKLKNVESSSIIDTNHYLNISENYEIISADVSIEEFKSGDIISINNFLLMLSVAYNSHKPIILKPDDLWLLICQGFAEHIKFNSNNFLKKLIKSGKKSKIKINRIDFQKGKENSWEKVFQEFTTEIDKKSIGNLKSNIVLEFSTTTPKEKIAFEIAFMDSMSTFIDYEVYSICGIPEIEIKGTIEDYAKIITNLTELKKHDLDWWVDKIIPLISEIIKALKGEINKEFWQSIFRVEEECGGNLITGWITKFFPYIDEYNDKGTKLVLSKNSALFEENERFDGLDDFPRGISKVPFKWKCPEKTYKMNFISGFIGVRENTQSNRLETEINWIVCESSKT